MAFDFIAIGGATRDISFFTNDGVLFANPKDILRQKLLAFEYGAKIRVDHFYYTYGGGAANVAVNLSNFGFKSACLAAVGDDEDREQHGVDPVLALHVGVEQRADEQQFLLGPAGASGAGQHL